MYRNLFLSVTIYPPPKKIGYVYTKISFWESQSGPSLLIDTGYMYTNLCFYLILCSSPSHLPHFLLTLLYFSNLFTLDFHQICHFYNKLNHKELYNYLHVHIDLTCTFTVGRIDKTGPYITGLPWVIDIDFDHYVIH